MRIAHLTDPHLSSLAHVRMRDLRGKRWLGYQSWRRKRRHRYRREVLDELVRALHTDAPDLVLVTGDLVHIGLRDEFRQAREWLEGVGSPTQVRLVPGNHDCYHPQSWSAAKELYGDYLPAADRDCFPGVELHGPAAVVLASSAHPAPWWGAIGTLGATQRRRVGEALANHQHRLRVMALHHPPLPASCSWRKALTDARQLSPVLQQGKPHITLHGHLHHNRMQRTAYGRTYCTASAASASEAAPASYRLFDIVEDPASWAVTMRLKTLYRGALTDAHTDRFELPR